jgi:sulfide:quinone oxidoreductase
MKAINTQISVAPQIRPEDLADYAQQGFRSVICNRPDGEGADQPVFEEIEAAAKKLGLEARYLPIVAGKVRDEDADAFGALMDSLPPSSPIAGPGHALGDPVVPLPGGQAAAGRHPRRHQGRRLRHGRRGAPHRQRRQDPHRPRGRPLRRGHRRRRSGRYFRRLEPAFAQARARHRHHRPGRRPLLPAGLDHGRRRHLRCLRHRQDDGLADPPGVHWIKSAVAAFEPKDNAVILDGCRVVKYNRLVVCPGLKLDWHKVDGLVDTLGKNGVTSNYRYDLAPYTWELVQGLRKGRALFTQPPMPIKCAGAPQKALYLSARSLDPDRRLGNIDIQFMNAGGVLFGVKDYVPALMEYVKRYNAELNFFHNLTAIDGPAKKAVVRGEGTGKGRAHGRGRLRHDPCDAAADRAGFHPRLAAGGRRRLGRRRPDHPAPQDLRQHLVAGRRDERAQRQDRRGRAQAGARRCREIVSTTSAGTARRHNTTVTAPVR